MGTAEKEAAAAALSTRRPFSRKPPATSTPARLAASAWSLPTPPARETSSPSWTTSPSWTRSEQPSSETRRKCSLPSEAPRRCTGLTIAWPLCLAELVSRWIPFTRTDNGISTVKEIRAKPNKKQQITSNPTDVIVPSKAKHHAKQRFDFPPSETQKTQTLGLVVSSFLFLSFHLGITLSETFHFSQRTTTKCRPEWGSLSPDRSDNIRPVAK